MCHGDVLPFFAFRILNVHCILKKTIMPLVLYKPIKIICLFSYIIDELHSSNEFLLSVNLSVCLETTECMLNRTVAENVRLPKPTCNWNTGYKIPGKK